MAVYIFFALLKKKIPKTPPWKLILLILIREKTFINNQFLFFMIKTGTCIQYIKKHFSWVHLAEFSPFVFKVYYFIFF